MPSVEKETHAVHRYEQNLKAGKDTMYHGLGRFAGNII